MAQLFFPHLPLPEQIEPDTCYEHLDFFVQEVKLDKLKRAITTFLEENTAFLILDDAHCCDAKFRMWLKQLRRSDAPMLLLATDPPRTDIFINIPRIELRPLPEYAIREI